MLINYHCKNVSHKNMRSPMESRGEILSGGYEAWERYRDQIVGDGR